jgi:hypothetical protein
MNFFHDVFLIIQQIPSSFWGVVIGSFFSLAGVAIANRASDRRLRTQFEYARKQKIRDGEMALRKDVYLAAAEAVAAGMEAIGRLANFDLSNDQIISAYAEKAPAISKVHVIARIDTVQAFLGFTSKLGALYFTLFARRYELLEEKNAIAILDDQIADIGKARDHILELIKQHNIEGVIDAQGWKNLQEKFELEQLRIKDCLTRRTELAGDLYPKQLEFMRECAVKTTILGQAVIPVLSAVRAELELPLDEQTYRQVMEKSLASQQEAISDFVKKFMPETGQPLQHAQHRPVANEVERTA